MVPGKGSVVGERFVTHPDVRKICFTGSTAVGPADHARRGRPGQAGHARARRQERQHRLRRLGPRARRRARARTASSTTPARTAAPAAGSSSSAASSTGSWSTSSRRCAASSSPTRATRPPRWARSSAPASATGALLRRGRRRGRRRRLPRGRPGRSGYWYPADRRPARARRADRVWQEEVFGPVVAVLPFDDEADAIAKANDTAYGLSGSIWTRDLGRGLRVARGVEAGNLSVNSHSSVRYSTPFGGFKQSGIGRELGPDALDAVHRGQERLHLDRLRPHPAQQGGRRPHGRQARRQGRGHHGRLLAASVSRRCGGSPRRAPRSSSATSTRRTARASPTRSAAPSCASTS